MKNCTEGHRLELGEDVGGRRHFLAGEPVHCGTVLEFFIPWFEIWVPVRFEVVSDSPVFFLWLGEDVGDARMRLPENATLRWPERSAP